MDWNGNRHKEHFDFRRVSWDTKEELGKYDFITGGSVDLSGDSSLKVTGSFNYKGTEVPDERDMLRVYYGFTDDSGEEAYTAIATLMTAGATPVLKDSMKGIVSDGKLDGASVLSVLDDDIVGRPFTIAKNENVISAAAQICKDHGLMVNMEACSCVMSADHTFDFDSSYLEIVNWLTETAGYEEAFPDPMGVVQLVSRASTNNRDDMYIFRNDDRSIMYPEIEPQDSWQDIPNVVKLIYNMDDACIIGTAMNLSGSKASLSERGNRKKVYADEIGELGNGSKTNNMKTLAETTLKNMSCDTEIVKFQHAWVPLSLHQPIGIIYSDRTWYGYLSDLSVDLGPAVKTTTKIKRTLYSEIEIMSEVEVLRGE